MILFVSGHFHSSFSPLQVLMSPRYTVLPWDSRTQPEYTLNYKVGFSSNLLGTSGSSLFTLVLLQVSGGGRVYGYSLKPDDLATVDSDGKVRSLCSPQPYGLHC